MKLIYLGSDGVMHMLKEENFVIKEPVSISEEEPTPEELNELEQADEQDERQQAIDWEKTQDEAIKREREGS